MDDDVRDRAKSVWSFTGLCLLGSQPLGKELGLALFNKARWKEIRD